MPRYIIDIDLPEEAEFKGASIRHNDDWAVMLETQYTSEGLGGHSFYAEAPGIQDAVNLAGAKLTVWLREAREAKKNRPPGPIKGLVLDAKPKVKETVTKKEADDLLNLIGKALKQRPTVRR